MKRFLSSLAVCIISLAALATDQQTDTRPLWGLKVAINHNIPGKWHAGDTSLSMFKSGFGVSAGTVCNIYLGRNFYLEPGASLFYDTYSFKDLAIMGESGITENDPSLYKLGIRIPVIVGYSFDITDNFAMSVFMGPELSYAFAGKIRYRHPELIDDAPDELFGDYQRRCNLAWKIGLGVPFNNFFVSIEAALGLTNLSKMANASFRENCISLNATYYF